MQSRAAVVVGIDRYPDPALTDLAGAVADARAMAALLIERFEFAPGAVELLVDGAATASAIEAALGRLAERVEPGGVAVFFFAGHGARRFDASGDEADGWDETIVPVDSGRGGRPDRDIDDDTLATHVARLAARAAPVVIFDCCHSGSVTREGGETIRRAPPGAGARRGGLRTKAVAHVSIAAAAADESARERPPAPGRRPRGLLTTALDRALRAAAPEATWRQVMATVGAEVTGKAPRQHPQLEGVGRGWRVFGAGGEDEGWVAADHRDGAVRVALGRLHGVAVGDRLAVMTVESDRVLATVAVEAVGAVACRCGGIPWREGPLRARLPPRPSLWETALDDGLEVGFDADGLIDEAGRALVEDGETLALRVVNPGATTLYLALVRVGDAPEVLMPPRGVEWALAPRAEHVEPFEVTLPAGVERAVWRLVLVAVNLPFDAAALGAGARGVGVPSVAAARCTLRRLEVEVTARRVP